MRASTSPGWHVPDMLNRICTTHSKVCVDERMHAYMQTWMQHNSSRYCMLMVTSKLCMLDITLCKHVMHEDN